MDHDQPTYVYVTENRNADIGIPECAILFLGAAMLIFALLTKLSRWVLAVAADPISRPYEAIVLAVMFCIAAYIVWRCVRRMYFILRALWFFFYDRWLGIQFYLRRKFR